MAYVWWAARGVISGPSAFAFPRDDLFRYSATWWNYPVPPVAHPMLGDIARRAHAAAGAERGSARTPGDPGLGLLALGAAAGIGWLVQSRRSSTSPSRTVPALVLIAGAAWLCSLSPEAHVGRSRSCGHRRCSTTSRRCSGPTRGSASSCNSWSRCWRVSASTRSGAQAPAAPRFVAVALLLLAAGEYAVRPSALWRDVLPTTAHRWVANGPAGVRVADCAAPTGESASVWSLTGGRVLAPGGPLEDCTAAELPATLAALGYTHLLVRHDTWAARWFAGGHAPDGLTPTMSLADSDSVRGGGTGADRLHRGHGRVLRRRVCGRTCVAMDGRPCELDRHQCRRQAGRRHGRDRHRTTSAAGSDSTWS